MRNLMLFILVSVIILTSLGCSKNAEKESYPVYEGTVVYKIEEDGKYQFLVLDHVSKEELQNGQFEDFIALAQNQSEASYYYVDKASYETIDVGQRVKINAHVDQLEPLPPIRTVVSIEKMDE